MFYIIGIGLSLGQLTLEAKQTLLECKEVYMDNYTNIYTQEIKNLEKIINKKIIFLKREEIEVSKNFIKDGNCLLVVGNPFSATTHYSLREDLKKKGVDYKVLLGISIFNYRGSFGLQEYKFGKTVSIVFSEKNFSPTSFFKNIVDNLSIHAHTLCLLDIKVQENRFMSGKQACEILEKIDVNKILQDKLCVLLCGMGGVDERIISFTFKDYKKLSENYALPQSLVICGKLNVIERENVYEFFEKY